MFFLLLFAFKATHAMISSPRVMVSFSITTRIQITGFWKSFADQASASSGQDGAYVHQLENGLACLQNVKVCNYLRKLTSNTSGDVAREGIQTINMQLKYYIHWLWSRNELFLGKVDAQLPLF